MNALYGSQPSAGASAGGSSGGSSPGSSSWWNAIPVIGPVLDIVSSILGIDSQNKANKMNYAIQQQSNALNYQMFQEQQKFAWDMWKSTNKYNSPAHQRELMQAAGFNPNLIFGYNQGSALNISSPTPNGAQVGAPMQPAYRPEYMQGVVNNSVQAAAVLSEARLKDAQAAGQRVDNLYNAKVKEADLLLKHDTHTAQAIQNEIDYSSRDDKKQVASLQNEKTIADTKRSLSEAALNKVMERYNDAKIDEVKEAINLLVEQQNETAARAKMQYALGSKYLAEKALADVQRTLAPAIAASQIAANQASASRDYSQSEINSKMAAYQSMVNDVYKVFGKGKAAQDFLNAMYNGDLQFWQAEDFAEAAREKKIFNKYEDTHKWIRNAKDIMSFVREFFGTMTSQPGKPGLSQ